MTAPTASGHRLSVAFVCQWYAPEPVTQPGWIVDALRDQGADVEVLTGIPNYPTGTVQPGYRAWRPRRDRVDGVTVHRYPLYPSHDSRASRRMANYVSWALTGGVLAQRTLRTVDVALVYSSPATAATAALVAQRLRGVPYVLLVQDVWPDSVFASGYLAGLGTRVAHRLLDRMVNTFYARASKILVISPGMIDLLASRGVPRDKLALVYNWVPEDSAPSSVAPTSLREELVLAPSDFVLLYAGNHGAAQALTGVVEGMALLPPTSRAHLVLVGDGVEKARLRDLATRVAPDRVHFLEPMARERLVPLMGEADAHLVTLADDPLFTVTMPSKVQSILSSGAPALVCAAGDAARVVTQSGAGTTCRPGDPAAFAAAVADLEGRTPEELRAMGERGRHYYLTHMAPDVGAELLMTHLREAASRKPAYSRAGGA